jgi:hypothetical protein
MVERSHRKAEIAELKEGCVDMGDTSIVSFLPTRLDFGGYLMQATKRLTRFFRSQEFGPAIGVEGLLEAVGLELWQAPEGFWAIRVKPTAASTPPAQPARRRRLEGRA